jgi:hypothetical protein
VRVTQWIALLSLLVLFSQRAAFADDAPDAPAKPKVAVFPISGTADEELRQHCDFALRAKLDRDGTYEPIAGVVMQDLVADAKAPISFDTAPDILKDLSASESPTVFVWGDLNVGNGGLGTLRLKILDLRDTEGKPVEFTKEIMAETEFRFAFEEALQKIKGVKKFEHPDEEDVHHDEATDAAFAKNPNLVIDGNFATEGHWEGLYTSRVWQAKLSDQAPGKDDVVILKGQKEADSDKPHNVLVENLSLECAQNNGMACLSDPIKIEPGIKYRISFRFKSDGPTHHVFVKGYVMAKDIAGKPELREIYRRQVSPSGDTHGQWVAIECDMSPQHVAFPVQFLKIDLYTYLSAGTAMFSDVQLKAIGKQAASDQMKDDAIKRSSQ